MNFFGLEVAMIGYQGTVFPVLLAVWFMSLLEKQLRRLIPDALDLILTPFLTVIISGFIALLIIGRPVVPSATASHLFSARLLPTPVGWRDSCLAGCTRLLLSPVSTTASTLSKPGCSATRRSASISCCLSGQWLILPRAAPVWRCGLKPKMRK